MSSYNFPIKHLQLDASISFFYESQPVGLAEVIDASEASLGGPGGGQSGESGCKQGQIGGDNGF